MGEVTGTAQPVGDFTVRVGGADVPILRAPGLRAERMDANYEDPERSECAARVRWEHALPREDAATWPGVFANQNTVCRLRDELALDRLAQAFGLDF